MKRRIISILTALALCLSLLPTTALAIDVKVDPNLPDNPEGATIAEVKSGEVMACNYGTVETNEG